MEDLLKIQKKLVPQVVQVMQRRYSVLRQIYLSQPVGRRALSKALGISERIVRSETDFLRDEGLIEVSVSGMTITVEGIILLEDSKDIMNDILGLSELQQRVKKRLGIKKVILALGSYEDNQSLMKDVAKLGANYFLKTLKDGDIVSIAGGSTMLEFANEIKTDKKYKNVVVVPARGSMGKKLEIQSNNIVENTSKKLGSSYKLLHIPDELGEEAMKTIRLEPQIKNTLDKIQKTDILVFGLGIASEMTVRRRLSEEKIDEISKNDAVGEVFGHYFNADGKVVYKLNTVSIDLNTFKNIKENIVIFAGSKKSAALIALTKINKNIVLVTDEVSAKKILELSKDNKNK